MNNSKLCTSKRVLSVLLAVIMLCGSLALPTYAAGEGTSGGTGGISDGYIDLSGKTEYNGVKLATGATVTKAEMLKEEYKANIVNFGAVALEDREAEDTDTHAIENTEAINKAILDAAEHGGGTVVVPEGTFRAYTIELKSNVNIFLSEGAVIQAAKAPSYGRDGSLTAPAEDEYEDGTPGNYLQPEVNIYAGLQDGGHTYFANSLFYAADEENIMIYGGGRIDGSQMNDGGTLDQVLSGNDPGNPSDRTGRAATWYGNKGIALLRCKNVVLDGFDMLNCGHFAIINEGTINMLVNDLVVDTNRDAFNIDCGQNVTIQNSHFNSLTDDAIVFKASYGAGVFRPVQNCLVRNCVVSGYDAGSVLAGTYTTDKQVATDACGPTARIKFGTESTCGYNTVTITDVEFQRSRGFCMETVDGSDIHDIIMVNATMDTVSSSPIFIRIGNRGRYPVTGNTTDTALNQRENVRLTNNGWILPQNSADSDYTWTEYPIQHYFPAYSTDNSVTMSNGVRVSTVNQTEPTRLNANNYFFDEETGVYHPYKWDTEAHTYVVDTETVISEEDLCRYGDAVGYEELADAYNIYVGNVDITNVDPRYPITLAGLVDSKIENVTLEDVHVTYRGGIRMRDAVEQQQLSSSWNYTQYMTAPSKQNLPWLVNTFFAKNAALLPRVDWDPETSSWVDDPYNVPEMPEQYPEPSNFGILPAYGLYARHVDGLNLIDVSFDFEIDDERHAVVLDDVQNSTFTDFTGETIDGVETVALVSNNYKRATSFEYVLNEEYRQTTCENVTGIAGSDIKNVTVNAPEPSTPKDDLYSYDTIASPENGYSYGENVWTYNGKNFSYPVTVYRPFFSNIGEQAGTVGEEMSFTVSARNPAAETAGEVDQAASDATLTYSVDENTLPAGAKFDPETHTFTWRPTSAGTYQVTFHATDGVMPVSTTVAITVTGGTPVIPNPGGNTGKVPGGNSGDNPGGTPATDPMDGFTDLVDGAWYTEAVKYMLDHELMQGISGTEFAPDMTTTRAMVTTILWRNAGKPDATGGTAFSDVPAGAYYAGAVQWASANKVVEGYPDGSFNPDGSITREQLVAMLWRYAGEPEAAEAALANFSDAGNVGDYAKTAMAWAVEKGIINGMDATTLAPTEGATRAQIAKMVMVYCQSAKA